MSSSIFGHLEVSLHGYLADVTQRAQTSDEHAAADLARYELPRVAAALQAVLNEHQPDERGRCRSCRGRTFGRPPAPCRAYLTAHLCLMVTEDNQAGGGGRGVDAGARNQLGATG